MRIKTFLILVYALAGLVISSFTAFMTFLIIEEPIGYKMGSKIVLTVLLTVPVVMLLSSIIGSFFSRHINALTLRLGRIAKGDYKAEMSCSFLNELEAISGVSNALNKEINHLLSSLKERNEELTMLLLTFSHDVKTPLMISNGYIEELEDGMIKPSELPTIYKKLKNENDYINELCNDILKYEHSRSLEQRDQKSVALYTLVQEVIALLDAPVINEVQETFKVLFNEIDLKKILMNLLQNAQKYAGTDVIKVYAENNHIVVEDYGVGISKENQEKIFEPFYTIEASKNRQKTGFGLGLAITKNLCTRNNATIIYDELAKTGARFVITLNN